MDQTDIAMAFAAGAYSVAVERGMQKKSAASFARAVLCKSASSREDSDDDEKDTWWGRNKKWLIPALVGSLAFYVGAEGERHGRKDRGYISNAVTQVGRRLNGLLGIVKDPLYRSTVDTQCKA